MNTPITDRVAVLSLNQSEISFVNELNELEHVIWVSLIRQNTDAKRCYMNCVQLFIYSYLTYRI